MNCFTCCFSLSHTVEEPVDIKSGITDIGIIHTIDVTEENIELYIEPEIIDIIGEDLSGVVLSFVKKTVEPTLETVINKNVSLSLAVIENIAAPTEHK